MRELKAKGTTIILATHDMAEAEELSDRVAILLNKKIVTIGTPMEITATGAGLTKVSVRTAECKPIRYQSRLSGRQPAHIQGRVRASSFSTDIGPTVSAIITHIEAQGTR